MPLDLCPKVDLKAILYLSGELVQAHWTLPELVSPFNGQINVGTVTEFHWDKRGENPIDGNGAIKYHFQLTKGGFNSPIIDTSEVSSINILLEKPLEENTKYFWRVKVLVTMNLSIQIGLIYFL